MLTARLFWPVIGVVVAWTLLDFPVSLAVYGLVGVESEYSPLAGTIASGLLGVGLWIVVISRVPLTLAKGQRTENAP
jgi:hypothetical protein